MSQSGTEHTPSQVSLDDLRRRIDELDEQVLQLINERAKIVQQVGLIKNRSAMDYYVPSREKAIYDRLQSLNPGPLSNEAVRAVFRELISACRALESLLSIAYLGPEGSYHHVAAQLHFGRTASFIPVETIGDIINEVERQKTDFGVVAIENSVEGIVGMTLDRLAHSDVRILGEVYLPISHNLISHSELHEIEKVYSHPQALGQCRRWLETNLPRATLMDTHSTTQAVKICRDEKKSAAIASTLSAELFDVPIQVYGVEDYAGNTTRFYIIGHRVNPSTGADKTALIVFIRNQVGALYSMLEPFQRCGINLTNIVSRPTKQEAWQYMFFVECESHVEDKAFQQAIDLIEKNSLHVKILGSFHRARRNPLEA